MEDSTFIKYIIKRIVKVIYVNEHLDISRPYSDWFRIEKVSFNDNLLQEIINEGKRYGLSDIECQSYISMADDMINFCPIITEIRSSFDVCSVPDGTHVKFIYDNSSFGSLTIDAVKDGKHNFFILKSDIAALCWSDNITFTVNRLQIGTYPAFCVSREGKKKTTIINYFCPGRLAVVNICSPGITHEIIDSKTDFMKGKSSDPQKGSVSISRIEKSSKRETPQKNNIGMPQIIKPANTPDIHYLWPPSRLNPVAFYFTDKDRNIKSPEYPPFMATIDPDNTSAAKLTINPKFIDDLHSSNDPMTKSCLYLINSIIRTCHIKEQRALPGFVSNIRVVSNGTLTLSSNKKDVWTMDVAPVIIVE